MDPPERTEQGQDAPLERRVLRRPHEAGTQDGAERPAAEDKPSLPEDVVQVRVGRLGEVGRQERVVGFKHGM
jgi:hypothetical protein